MPKHAVPVLPIVAILSIVVPMMACVVNNNQSPGANGTISPTVTVDPNVAFAMPGASAQATAQGTATVGPPHAR
jgi:hypothetical protein